MCFDGPYKLMSFIGTKRTSGNVRPMSAFGGEADIRRKARLPILTESGHLVWMVSAAVI